MKQLYRPQAILTTLGAVALAATLSTTASAADEGKRGGKLEHFCEHAKCTDGQKQEIHNVMREFRTDTKSDHEKIRGLHERLVAEFVKDKPNEKLMDRIYAQIDQIHANIVDRRHDMLMEMHGVLNAEQRKLVAKRLLKGPGHGGKHRKRPDTQSPKRK